MATIKRPFDDLIAMPDRNRERDVGRLVSWIRSTEAFREWSDAPVPSYLFKMHVIRQEHLAPTPEALRNQPGYHELRYLADLDAAGCAMLTKATGVTFRAHTNMVPVTKLYLWPSTVQQRVPLLPEHVVYVNEVTIQFPTTGTRPQAASATCDVCDHHPRNLRCVHGPTCRHCCMAMCVAARSTNGKTTCKAHHNSAALTPDALAALDAAIADQDELYESDDADEAPDDRSDCGDVRGPRKPPAEEL